MALFELGNFTAGALIGIVLGYFLEHALASRRNNTESIRKGYNEAAKNFRDSFNCVSQSFENGINPVGHAVLNNFKLQEIAMFELVSFLKGGIKTKFEEAWDDYKGCYEEFFTDFKLKITEQEFLAEFKKLITKLTDFAKHK